MNAWRNTVRIFRWKTAEYFRNSTKYFRNTADSFPELAGNTADSFIELENS